MAGGLVLPLFRAVHTLSQMRAGALAVVTTSAWSTRFQVTTDESLDRPGAPFGVPITVTVVLLAAAVGLLLARQRLGAWLGQVGVVFAAGVVLTIEMVGLGQGQSEQFDSVELTTGLGMWLLVTGTLVAAAAAVVTHRTGANRAADWADPAVAYADTDTPPSGFAMPEVQSPGGVAITVLPPEAPPEPPDRPWEQPGR
jgi:drug/metabolite transporter (DMT)-like permease